MINIDNCQNFNNFLILEIEVLNLKKSYKMSDKISAAELKLNYLD